MVEHRLPKPGVAGSIPVSRFKCNYKIKSRSGPDSTLRHFDFIYFTDLSMQYT